MNGYLKDYLHIIMDDRMRKISHSKKMKVVEDYVAGYPFKQIASRAKVSEGSVSNIINELHEA